MASIYLPAAGLVQTVDQTLYRRGFYLLKGIVTVDMHPATKPYQVRVRRYLDGSWVGMYWTDSDGKFEIPYLAYQPYTVLGFDRYEEWNSVLFERVFPVPMTPADKTRHLDFTNTPRIAA